MRSTFFVFVSILIHIVCLASLTLMPIRTVGPVGQAIEVEMGEPADQPGVEAPLEPEAPTVAAAPPEPQVSVPKPEPVVAPAAPKPAPPKPARKAKATPAPKAAPIASNPVMDLQGDVDVPPESLESTAEKTPTEEPIAAAPVEPTDDFQKVDEPEQVEAKTEADSSDLEKGQQDPAPTATAGPPSVAPTEAPIATSSQATPDQGQSLGKGGATKEGAVSVLQLKQMPGNKPPAYPERARREQRQGQLELVYRVTREGKVADIQIVKSTGSQDLDSEATQAIAKFKFVPGQEGWAKHPVVFNLKGTVTSMPSRLRSKGAQTE